jgi:hypothetical protein
MAIVVIDHQHGACSSDEAFGVLLVVGAGIVLEGGVRRPNSESVETSRPSTMTLPL